MAFNHFRSWDDGGGYDPARLRGVYNHAARHAPPTPAERAAEKAEARKKATRDLLKEMDHDGNASPRDYMVRAYIKEGADLEATHAFFELTPLGIAAMYDELPLVRALVKGGADYNKLDVHGHNPFLVACGYEYLNMVKYFLKLGVDVNQRTGKGETALICATRPGCRLKTIKLLIAAGARIDAADNDGKTALDYCREGKDDYRRWGGTYDLFNKRTEGGRTGMEVYTELERVLLDSWYAQYLKDGAPVIERRWASTVLNAAVAQNDDALVAAMLKAGADVNAPDIKGTTPLIAATQDGHVAMMRRLVAAGADIDAPDADGASPLMTAIYPYHGDALGYLMERNALVDLKDKYGKTALDYAWQGAGAQDMLEGRPGREIYEELKASLEEAAKRQALEQYQSGLRNAVPASAKITLVTPASKQAPPPMTLRLGKPGTAL